ncbi:ankyrin repeat domain-containing protein 50-like [Haliotis asinina]|uniref:ankyrin repeat domain-containing protein 50-like n=1 Tax=Haliotis asinina TaxID=109174 RepID=UPI0035324EB5
MELPAVVFFTLVLYGIKAVHADTSMSSFTARVRRVEGEIRAWKVMAVDAETKLINNFTELENSLQKELNETFIPSLIKRLVKQTITDLLTEDYTRNITSDEVHTLKASVLNATKQLETITQELRRVKRERDTYKESLGKLRGELTEDLRDVQLQLNQTVDDAKSYARMRCCGVKEIKEDESSLSGTISSMANPGRTAASTTDLSEDLSQNGPAPPPRVTIQNSDPQATPSRADSDLFSACKDGDLERVKQILAAGNVDINTRGEWESSTPLMEATRNGHRDVVKFLVDRGANVSLVNEEGDNILHLACAGGDLETVKLILSLKAVDINSRGDLSKTPVMVAAHGGHSDVVEFLVDRGANVSLVDSDGDNVLHLACYSGDLETVEHILSLNKVDINATNINGQTAIKIAKDWQYEQVVDLLESWVTPSHTDRNIYSAIKDGDLERLNRILAAGHVDINMRTGRLNWTLVMVAALQGQSDVVKFLMDRGANVSLVDKYGNNALHWACSSGDLDTVKLILSENMKIINSRGYGSTTPVMLAAVKGQSDVMKLLLDRGANVSLVDVIGYNVLHFACIGGNLETVKLILSQDVIDINSRGNGSRTPVMDAAWKGDRNMVKLLLDRGANVSLVDETGDNVLHFACIGGNLETVKLILSQDVIDINSRGNGSRTPVMDAAWKGDRNMVKLLLDRGANVSLVDETGDNVLHFACIGGDLKTVKLILSLNVIGINSRGCGSRTSVMEAALKGHQDVVNFLVGRGANVSLVDETGNNVLHFACIGGDLETVKLILSLTKVEINARNFDGRTATDLARDKGHQSVVDFLVSHDAH